MKTPVRAFSATKLARAIRGAEKAGKVVTAARIYVDDSIELEMEDAPPVVPMTEAELIAGLEALEQTNG